jgi:hypothetical protein
MACSRCSGSRFRCALQIARALLHLGFCLIWCCHGVSAVVMHDTYLHSGVHARVCSAESHSPVDIAVVCGVAFDAEVFLGFVFADTPTPEAPASIEHCRQRDSLSPPPSRLTCSCSAGWVCPDFSGLRVDDYDVTLLRTGEPCTAMVGLSVIAINHRMSPSPSPTCLGSPPGSQDVWSQPTAAHTRAPTPDHAVAVGPSRQSFGSSNVFSWVVAMNLDDPRPSPVPAACSSRSSASFSSTSASVASFQHGERMDRGGGWCCVADSRSCPAYINATYGQHCVAILPDCVIVAICLFRGFRWWWW